MKTAHLPPITGQTVHLSINSVRCGEQFGTQKRHLWKRRHTARTHTRSHIPSSAWQSSSSFSNNIQSTEISVLRRSMFVWPVPRGSCHLSPACAQRTAAGGGTHSVSERSGRRLGNQCGMLRATRSIWYLGGGFYARDWRGANAMEWDAETGVRGGLGLSRSCSPESRRAGVRRHRSEPAAGVGCLFLQITPCRRLEEVEFILEISRGKFDVTISGQN